MRKYWTVALALAALAPRGAAARQPPAATAHEAARTASTPAGSR